MSDFDQFALCDRCYSPIHCERCRVCVLSNPTLPVQERAGPPNPTKRGSPWPEGGGPKIVDVDYTVIEKRVMARMQSINGAAEHVVERFCELSKTDSGTPLFKPRFSDGSFTPTGRLLCNLVVEAIQGEVTL